MLPALVPSLFYLCRNAISQNQDCKYFGKSITAICHPRFIGNGHQGINGCTGNTAADGKSINTDGTVY